MPNLTVPIVRTAALPAGYCYPIDPETFFEDIIARIIGMFTNNLSGIIISSTEPGVNDRDKLWFDTNGNDNQIYGWVPSIGAWGRKHPFAANSAKRIWFPLETDLATEDGGSAGVVGDASGPFWIRDTDYDGRFPLAKGDIPNTNPVVSVAEGATGGEYVHSLTEAEMPPHTHTFQVEAQSSTDDGTGYLVGGGQFSPHDGFFNGVTDNTGGVSNGATPPVYTVDAHNTMPPYRVGLWAYRSARIWILPPP